MGKDLKGKELGVGISQRKDGLYTARFTDRNGKRKQQYFKKLQECRARGYYCKTVGNLNEETIKRYRGEQYERDRMEGDSGK